MCLVLGEGEVGPTSFQSVEKFRTLSISSKHFNISEHLSCSAVKRERS